MNRVRILQSLYDFGPLSRAELARVTGLSRSALTVIVEDLVRQGLLTQEAARPSSPAGGKPARPLWFAPDSPPLVGVHLLPGRVETALVSAGGKVLTKAERVFSTEPDAQAAIEALVSATAEVADAASTTPLGVGVAVGGMVDSDTGTVVKVALAPELDGLPVGRTLQGRLGLHLVCVDMHPRAQALGDRWFGQGRGRSHFASVYTGEALGVGLVVGGDVHRGPAGAGGEVGHSIVQVDGELCHCGQRGCWETLASHSWLRAQAASRGLPGATTLGAGALSRLAAARVPHAAELLDEWAGNLAVGLVNLHQVFAPGLFILHGDTVAGGEELRSRIERALHSRIPPHPGGPPQVAFTALEDHATLLGAAGLVLSHHFNAPGPPPPRDATPSERPRHATPSERPPA
ncbi:ROK family transcriptional regulator [Streptomyces tubbatahanensis]|uniref:ROK family transcriptional regulator n=1 Tax=Streptomyces tubbatahanensis TaxID=2923272 RepID=A0ABY3XLC3_9ACTN|nr:ROK family transcriptional regulator [Streptomyces tubbatahanensis]UNS95205.1 ROK family transcriptional regulator [Streptomyces tubbatahanensis]